MVNFHVLVALPSVRDLLLWAKHLFIESMGAITWERLNGA